MTLAGYIEQGMNLLRLTLKSVEGKNAIVMLVGVLTILTRSLAPHLVYVCAMTSLRAMCYKPFGG